MSDAHDQKQASTKPPRKTRPASASGESEDDSAAQEQRDPQPCMPCHGTGKVISNLGGHTRKVTCPWCRGGGVRLTGADAQEWHEEQQRAVKRP